MHRMVHCIIQSHYWNIQSFDNNSMAQRFNNSNALLTLFNRKYKTWRKSFMKMSSHERGYISYCLMPSYILNDQYNWFSRTYFSMLYFFIMKYYVVIYIVIHIITLIQYATQFFIYNIIFNIICNNMLSLELHVNDA